MEIIQHVKDKITSQLQGAVVEIIDDSAEHIGHHNSETAYLTVIVTYDGFKDKSLIEQHQMINDILKDELNTNKIHALRIKTKVN